MPFTFNEFQGAVVRRVNADPRRSGGCLTSDLSTAMAREVFDMDRRIRERGPDMAETRKAVSRNLGDIAALAAEIADRIGVNFGDAVAERFKEVDEPQADPDKLIDPAPPSWSEDVVRPEAEIDLISRRLEKLARASSMLCGAVMVVQDEIAHLNNFDEPERRMADAVGEMGIAVASIGDVADLYRRAASQLRQAMRENKGASTS